MLTDGARSHPNSQTHSAEAIRELREDEVRAALDALGAQTAALKVFRQPDGFLGKDEDETETVFEGLIRLIRKQGIETVFVTWGDDPHPDHAAAYRLVKRIGETLPNLALFSYPIWGLTLDDEMPVTAPFRSAIRYEIRQMRDKKRTAIDCFKSQLGMIIHDDPDAFSLTPEDIDRFSTDFEVFIDLKRDGDMPAVVTSVPTEHFDELYRKNVDPWNYVENHYEQDRFEKTIAALPDRHFESACEIGCSIGVLTEKLALRADRLIGLDCSLPALEEARRRLQSLTHVTVKQMRVPDELPEGHFDLIVFSEVLYFFSDADLARLKTFVESRVLEGGVCLLVNFLGDTESPQTGAEAAEKFIALTKTILHSDASRTFEGFRIDVLTRIGIR